MISAITESLNWPIKTESKACNNIHFLRQNIAEFDIISLTCCFRVEVERMSRENCTEEANMGGTTSRRRPH